MLGLAALLVYLAESDVRFATDCGSGGKAMSDIAMVVAWFAGVVIVCVGAAKALTSRSWLSALVPFSGVCLIACGIALAYLSRQAWGGDGCSD